MPDGTPGCIRYSDGTCGCRQDCSTDEATAASAQECERTGGVFDYDNCACQNYCTGQAALDCIEAGKMLTQYPECDCVDIPSAEGSSAASSGGSSEGSCSSGSSRSSGSSDSSTSSEESSSSDPCAKYKCYNGCPAVQDEDGTCFCDCNGDGCTNPYSEGCSAAGDGWYYGGSRCNVVTACPGRVARGDKLEIPDPYQGGWSDDGPYVPA